MDFPRLVSMVTINTTPITHSWRFKQRQNILKTHSLYQIYSDKLYSDIHSLKKSLCLEELLGFFEKQRKFLIDQYYCLVIETYWNFPQELHQKICSYVKVPIKIIK
tara:strand:+ start:245 stop:562 length:318 start_codon:yes stop_codon:yes gene_type:complete